MPLALRGSISFCGHQLSSHELQLIGRLVDDFRTLSLTELAATVCELLDWRRANGTLKTRECFSLLQQLQARSELTQLPAVRRSGPRGPHSIALDEASNPQTPLVGLLRD